MGDAIMAVFNRPVTALRATLKGLEMDQFALWRVTQPL